MTEQRTPQHRNPPLKVKRWGRWFWCEAVVDSSPKAQWIHFQLSSEWTEFSQESKTTIPFYYRYRSLAESSTLSSLKEKYDNFNLLTSGNNCGVFSFLSYEHNKRIRQFMIAKLRPIRRLFSRYCSWNLNEALSSTKDHFVETQCRSPWQLTLRHPFLFYNGPLVDNSCII